MGDASPLQRNACSQNTAGPGGPRLLRWRRAVALRDYLRFFDFDLGGKQNVKLSLVLCLLPFRIAHENPGRVGAIGGSVCNKQRHCQDVLSAVCCARMCCVMETIGRYFKNLPAAPTFVQTRTSSKKKGPGALTSYAHLMS